jgi:hypothetical protein
MPWSIANSLKRQTLHHRRLYYADATVEIGHDDRIPVLDTIAAMEKLKR